MEAAPLETEGLVQSVQSKDDRRVRTIALSKSGRQVVTRAKRTAWPVIEAAVAEMPVPAPHDHSWRFWLRSRHHRLPQLR